MKKALLYLASIAVSMAALQAAPLLTLDPLGGALSGTPGSTVGWGFTLTNTTDFLVVAATDFCITATQPTDLPCATQVQSVGTYNDFSAINFIVVGPSPYTTTVTQTFNAIAQTGFGSFAISGGATVGTILNGQLAVVYQLFDADPANGGQQIGGDNFISSPASITVTGVATGTPEPGTMLTLCLGTACILLQCRRPPKM